ncbi:MAG: hypothetical protein HOW73_39525 [Polyangiaceae bacterium]|nr:hypothetical protein [Polyangiaceae bacterium]
MPIPQLETLVAKFVSDLQAAFRANALESVQKAFGGESSVGGRRPSAALAGGENDGGWVSSGRTAKRTAKPGKRIRRNSTDLAAVEGRILEYVRANPGQGAQQIKRALRLSTKDWTLPIARLVDGKKLKSKGEKRSRVYWL